MKFLIFCSSSGGHIYPGINFATYLKDHHYEVKFLGIKNQIEEKIIPQEELILCSLPKSFKKACYHPLVFFKEINFLNKIIEDFDVIVGFGGFISFAISLTPSLKKKKFYLHEANVDVGDANKFAINKAKYLFTSFKTTTLRKYQKKIKFVGNPTVDNLLINKKNRKYISFIFGSLGSKTLLDIVFEYLNKQNDQNEYLLITSKRYYNEYKNINKQNVKVIDYVEKNYLYSYSKLIFFRGGASSLSEIMNANVNCVCIPSPYVKHNHQFNNANYLFSHHALTLIEEKDFNFNKIEEAINAYQSECAKMELINQKSFYTSSPSLKMFLTIIND